MCIRDSSNCRAFALVYSIDDRASFDETVEIYQQIIASVSNPAEITVVLVGNKCDLEECREVETSEGREVAKKHMNNCTFVETSAKDGTNVQNFFGTLVVAMSGLVKKSVAVQRRPRSTSIGAKAALIRGSLRMGGRRARERSHSQPDLSVYSTDSAGSFNFPDAATQSLQLPPIAPGENARKTRGCSIM